MMRPCFTNTLHIIQPLEISSARLSKKKKKEKRGKERTDSFFNQWRDGEST